MQPGIDRRPRVIAITGGIASGKSTVAGLLETRGYPVCSADDIVHALYREPAVQDWLVRFAGSEVVRDGVVDRNRLAAIVFGSPEKLRRLNAYIHPLVRRWQQRFTEDCDQRFVFHEIPLLFEAGMTRCVDWIVTVWAPLKQRIGRLMAKGMNHADAHRRMKNAAPEMTRLSGADTILFNQGSKDLLHAQVDCFIIGLERIPYRNIEPFSR